jgi:hypothetical protein
MIYITKPQGDGNPHPAVVVNANLAIPIYEKPWGVAVPIVAWKAAGLHRPSYAVLSQPWENFKTRRHLGDLEMEDRLRLYRASRSLPSLRADLETLV